MLTKLKEEVAGYFQQIRPLLSKLKKYYDVIFESVESEFGFNVFYDNQGKRRVNISNIGGIMIIFTYFVPFTVMGSLLLFSRGNYVPLLLPLTMLAFIIFIIIDVIAHYCPDDIYKTITNIMVLKELEKLKLSQFEKIFGFSPPDHSDEIFAIKITSNQMEVDVKLSELDRLRQEAFSEQKLIRERIEAFSQGEFAENPEKYTDEAKALTEEKKRIDNIVKTHKSDYDFARQLAWDFGYQAPGTKKRQ